MKSCWLQQQCIARCAAMDFSLPGFVQRHIQSCPQCRQRYQFEQRLTQQLSETAVFQRKEPSPFLHTRIMASIDQACQPAEPFSIGRYLATLRVRTGTVATVFGIFVITVMVLHFRGQEAAQTEEAVGAAPALFENVSDRLSLANGPKLLELSQSLEKPLDKELQGLTQDAKSALTYLARNFLPDPTSQKLIANSEGK